MKENFSVVGTVSEEELIMIYVIMILKYGGRIYTRKIKVEVMNASKGRFKSFL
jgi:hypothetical protein